MDNPTGTTPVQTPGADQPGNPQAPSTPQVPETLEEAIAIIAKVTTERDEAQDSALKANRAVEFGRKFEKFEDFQKTIVDGIASVQSDIKDVRKENEDLKAIISGKVAITPNTTTTPAAPTVTPIVTDEESRVKTMFGLPLSKP